MKRAISENWPDSSKVLRRHEDRAASLPEIEKQLVQGALHADLPAEIDVGELDPLQQLVAI
ncbi:MAG TPA: hypothetical protein VMT00_10710 [Thermoanaerobaculia bacterium]|nr:hypothetical protein [Thermoanaerobaculia bacterium]